MEIERKVITNNKEVWQAKAPHPGIKVGVGCVGPGGALPKPHLYSIEFTRLDSNGKPDPNHKTRTAMSGTPWENITDGELMHLLNEAKEWGD